MRIIILIITILFCFNVSAQQRQPIDSTQFIKLLSLKDLQEITQSLKDKMTVTEWEKVTQAIDKVYFTRRQEYLKSKDTAKTK